MQADRGHLHHRLIDMGLSQRQSVVIMYTASGALGLCAIVLADRGAISAIILLLAIAIFVTGGARYMGDMGSSPDSTAGKNGVETPSGETADKADASDEAGSSDKTISKKPADGVTK
jgi:UDP-GlcNAc:undecaprenyl-phosphate GlcNAc-1-phosphate transferase